VPLGQRNGVFMVYFCFISPWLIDIDRAEQKDLSLLTNMTHEDIQKLQTVSKDEQAERARYILLDNGELAYEQLQKSHERVDIILDNGLSVSLCCLFRS
jgi:hypothetical protein